MAFLTKKHLSRRTFLNGMGVTMALPFLESMVPAGTPLAQTAAAGRTRLGCIYVPHGATMDKWTPAAAGKGFELSEILQPLGGDVPERRACRSGAAGASRHHDGPVRRAQDRAGHAAPVARADD